MLTRRRTPPIQYFIFAFAFILIGVIATLSVQHFILQAKDLRGRVAGLVFFPAPEEPSIVTIVDVEKLKASNPEFYRDAQNGDKIMVYSNKAIIYRESTNQVINILPIERTKNDTTAQ